MDETLKQLFESIDSEILTDSVKVQMATLFESAVNDAVKAKETELEESNKTEIEQFKSELVTSVDEYLDYFSEKYVAENEVIVEDFTKVKLAEKIITNFGQMCEAFNISLSEESIQEDEQIDELKEEVNKITNELIEARKEIETIQKAAMITEAGSSFETDVQRELFFEKAAKLEFDKEIFESKLSVIKDQIIAEAASTSDTQKLNEQIEEPTKKTSSMDKYLNYLK